jgi:hypothetical protein
MTSNSIQERASASTSAAPVAPAACRGLAAANCAAYHMSSLPTARNILFEHLPQATCAAGRCTTYAQWQATWKHITVAAGVPQPSPSPSTGG